MSPSARVTAEIPEDGVAFAAAGTRQTDAIRMKAQARRTRIHVRTVLLTVPKRRRFAHHGRAEPLVRLPGVPCGDQDLSMLAVRD